MLKIIGETNPGRVRSMNQDVFAYDILGDNFAYAIVCDGMGGAQAGDVASKTTCDMVAGFFSRDLRPNMSEAAIKSVMLSAISAANAKVYSMSRENLEYSGMGTTIVAAVQMDNDLHIINVGDSRLYVTEEDDTVQVTRDHTVTQRMVELGELTEEQAKFHDRRHQLTRAVGVGDRLDIDYQLVELTKEQSVLLCSDGLTNYAEDDILGILMKKAVRDQNTKHLIDFANNCGGSDNITAVLLYRV